MPTWITSPGHLFTATELFPVSTTVFASGNSPTYKVISGRLPTGLSLSTAGTIYGTPAVVINTATSLFAIRATDDTGIIDRTFSIDVNGPDIPRWETEFGFLKLGLFGARYAFKGQWVDFQFTAVPQQTPENTDISYFILEGDGPLPPGLSLSLDGRLTGFVEDSEGSPTEKTYTFYVTASDGIASSNAEFKILVVDSKIFTADSGINIANSGTDIPSTFTLTSVSSLQELQFIKGNDLGVVQAGIITQFDVTAYDPAPYKGPVTYSIVPGNSSTKNLPSGLTFNTGTGIIRGYIPYQPAFTRTYYITVKATKTQATTGELAISTNTFHLTVEGNINSAIKWVSSSTLGNLVTGEISNLSIKAKELSSNYNISYRLIDGTLPDGINLDVDGALSGTPDYASTGTYQFTVEATDVYNFSYSTKIFTLNVLLFDEFKYTSVYAKPLLAPAVRQSYQDFMSDSFVFDPKIIYRYFDNNFGIQSTIKMYLEFAIEKVNLRKYYQALQENFYRKRLYFGDIKYAVAKDSSGNSIYEVVYVDIVDDQMNNKGDSVPQVIYSNDNIYYPNSVTNMRARLEQIVLDDGTYIHANEEFQPLFMQTAQVGDYHPAGYMRVVPLCYTLPGYGQQVISRIKLNGFDFKMINFEIDRLIVQNTLDSSTAKYLIFARQTISDSLPNDDILFGPDNVGLETNNNEPITRAII
jgi:hypothetical protein